MRLKIIYGLAVLLFLGACSQKKVKSYPEADAVYFKKVKTYRINTDGSITTREEKEQKLLTYRAFQSLFGDSHIFYNPDFQTVEVEKAFTTMADGKKVEVPQNGINDVLPAWCAGSKTYHSLREKIITHTGLERNAVIHAAWTISTRKDIFPFLSGIEILASDCPVEHYEVVVEVPENTPFHYKLLNSDIQPQTRKKDGFDCYTWQFSDIPQNIPESNISVSSPTVPVLLFSTQSNEKQVLEWLIRSENRLNETPPSALSRIEKEVKTLSLVQKILKARDLVVADLNTLAIPALLTGFKSRTPADVWQSNSATPYEKCRLLASIAGSLGANAEVCIKYPSYAGEEQLPFHLLAEPLVKAIAGKDTLYLSVTHSNKNASEFYAPQTIIRSIDGQFKQINSLFPKLEVNIDGKLTLDANRQIKGTLHSEYRNATVPWYALQNDKTQVPDQQINTNGKILELTDNKLVIASVPESKTVGTQRGDYLFVTLPESHEASASIIPPVLFSERIKPAELPATVSESCTIEVQVPASARLVNPVKEEIANTIGSVKITFTQDGNKIMACKQLEIKKPKINPEEYALFKQMMDKWHTPKFKELVIAIR